MSGKRTASAERKCLDIAGADAIIIIERRLLYG